MADFDGLVKGKISNDSTFKGLRSINLQDLKFETLHCFIVGPPLKALPDRRGRKKKGNEEGNIIPRVAEIVIDIKPSGAQVKLPDVEGIKGHLVHAVEFLIKNELLSLDEDTFSLVLVEKNLGLTDWLGKSFEEVFRAVRDEWRVSRALSACSARTNHTTVNSKIIVTTATSQSDTTTTIDATVSTTTKEMSHTDKIAENYKSMLLESMVADFLLDRHFHGCSEAVTCYDHLLLKLWTFNHWVYCERFCGFNHADEKTPLGK